jgi:hypothetical protein
MGLMESHEFLEIFLSGVVGGAALVAFLGKRWLDLRLKKNLAVFNFVLENRSRACSEILQAMGRVISVSRTIADSPSWIKQSYDDLSHAIVQLEDNLRPAQFLLEKGLYDKVHGYKDMARSLHKEYSFLKTDTERINFRDKIDDLVERLETQRNQISNELSEFMTNMNN